MIPRKPHLGYKPHGGDVLFGEPLEKRRQPQYHKGTMKAVIINKNDDIVHIVGLGLENEWDPYFVKDMESLCKRLNIKELDIIPGSKRRGEYASNVHGYGEKQWDLIPFTKCDLILIVSWRLCIDRKFRLAELPKLEAAMDKVIKYADCFSGVPSSSAKTED